MSPHKTIQIIPPRPLTQIEKELLNKLLSYDFPGRFQLKQQFNYLYVSEECEDCSNIGFSLEKKASIQAKIKGHIPIEAECRDSDGMTIHIILFVDNGYLDQLEIFREDNGKIKRLPNSELVQIVSNL